MSADGPGAGEEPLYSRDQVEQLRYVRNLSDAGFEPDELRRLLTLRREVGSTLPPSSDPAGSTPMLILLAERNLYAAELVEYLLRTEGYEVVIALDPQDAKAVFEARHPDLVFVELVISGGDGMQLCRDLKRAGARIVAVSALDLSSPAMEAGAEAFLRRPIDPLQVLSTVKDLMGSSSMTRRSTPAPEP